MASSSLYRRARPVYRALSAKTSGSARSASTSANSCSERSEPFEHQRVSPSEPANVGVADCQSLSTATTSAGSASLLASAVVIGNASRSGRRARVGPREHGRDDRPPRPVRAPGPHRWSTSQSAAHHRSPRRAPSPPNAQSGCGEASTDSTGASSRAPTSSGCWTISQRSHRSGTSWLSGWGLAPGRR